ncbi:MAG TPA: maleylpyruvate isomerase family mycothiol-dependent enzyme [Pseudonocardiaceae bacterium]
MAASSAWPTIHAERAALVEDLASLPEDRWRTPSLCGDWTVRDVLGHLTATAKMTPPTFFVKLASSGFRFDGMSAREVARETAGTTADGLAEFRRVLNRTSSPPGPADTWLGEVIVHGEDIRRPLGIKHAYPVAALTRIADFYKGSNLLIGAKNRIAGLTLTATDIDWSTGSGPEVRGPMLSLVMAMTGRSAALADLSGEGLDTLRGRMR